MSFCLSSKKIFLVFCFFSLTLFVNAQTKTLTFSGEKTSWHGFDRYDFVMDETTLSITPLVAPETEKNSVGAPAKGQRRCIVVVPAKAAAGNPWSWQGCYLDHEPQTEVELLKRGFYIAFITPDPGKQWDAWYSFLTENHGFAKKPAFIGMSKGGVNEYDWATINPDKVSCIYADNPAIRQEAFMKLGELVRNDVPLFNVCGSSDFLLERHTIAIENRYHELGGKITVIIKDGPAHHPHSIRNPKIIADWIEQNMKLTNPVRPDFADDRFIKTYYYSLNNSYSYLKEEDTYATTRGPGFTPFYERYDLKTNSQWGITAMAVIVPAIAAPGKPWVFRCGNISRQDIVDQALLARGFHIVISPITAQSGAVREQWDTVYTFLTGHGFSSRPVMEGNGPYAGEIYTWAAANPGKVSAIYGENPLMRSLMSKTSPLDNLLSLVKAGIPVLHISGSLDPWLNNNTRLLEKNYKKLGGKITIIIKQGEGHFLTLNDPKPVLDFIDKIVPELGLSAR